ncbi:hypothetical protein ACJQWK_01449 [Exserohilum turcicum]|uniref:Uncharacterized protein n=1 Tax=Exserohilum turcicum (strain 28A) TaxID=671987 RepID=R0IUA5_EXST2|nr:uncharacterized protein SETTUDRAFT_27205 [Exserohilum turcica Et28A]EOA88390.1 hypothetical protein SETTUDRAFT_27205 [Exserohilum turcica Et28A]
MQFTTIALLFSAAFTVSAAPGPDTLAKRSCWTLTGNELKICQDACKVTCDVATGGIARKLCKAACDAPPLKARDNEVVADAIDARGIGKKICDISCDVTCNSTVLALDQLECLKICKAKC